MSSKPRFNTHLLTSIAPTLPKQSFHTWKNHFTAVRSGAPPSFRMANWFKMTEHWDITLNMMRPCTLNPRLSAFKSMEGMYCFDATPMTPVRTELMIHLKPVCRHTWSYNTVKAWYFAPSLKHYLVINTTNEAGTVRKTDTWKYNHHSIKIPTVTPVNRTIKATEHLATAIQDHNDAPQDKWQTIEHLRALITVESMPISHWATEYQLETPEHRHLEPEHSVWLMAPFSECEPPTLDPLPIPVKTNSLSSEVLSHKDDE